MYGNAGRACVRRSARIVAGMLEMHFLYGENTCWWNFQISGLRYRWSHAVRTITVAMITALTAAAAAAAMMWMWRLNGSYRKTVLRIVVNHFIVVIPESWKCKTLASRNYTIHFLKAHSSHPTLAKWTHRIINRLAWRIRISRWGLLCNINVWCSQRDTLLSHAQGYMLCKFSKQNTCATRTLTSRADMR